MSIITFKVKYEKWLHLGTKVTLNYVKRQCNNLIIIIKR